MFTNCIDRLTRVGRELNKQIFELYFRKNGYKGIIYSIMGLSKVLL